MATAARDDDAVRCCCLGAGQTAEATRLAIRQQITGHFAAEQSRESVRCIEVALVANDADHEAAVEKACNIIGMLVRRQRGTALPGQRQVRAAHGHRKGFNTGTRTLVDH